MAFDDTRNRAELLLAPRKPQARTASILSSVKLRLGGDGSPGVISDPSQIAGPVRNTLTAAIANKELTQGLSTAVATVLTQFDAQKHKLLNGQFVPSDPLVGGAHANTSSGDSGGSGIPGVEAFFQFSALKPGQKIPTSFLSVIETRKTQLQSLARNFSKIFTAPSPAGVAILENTSPTVYPLAAELDKPDLSLLAVGGALGQVSQILKDKVKFAVSGVPTAQGKPSFWTRLTGTPTFTNTPNLNKTVFQQFKERFKSGGWSEPPSAYQAQYPYNRVQETESGHVIELDDTPGAERVHIFHRSGSFVEFHPDGSVVYKTMKHGYHVTMADEHVKVAGSCHVAVDGDSTLYVKGNAHIQSEGDLNLNARGDFNVFAKNINLRAKRTFKADGVEIDLRYLNLPTSIMPVSYGMAYIGFAPRVNLTAVSDDTGLIPNAPTPSMMTNPTAPMQSFPGRQDLTPPQNPLSNWSAYNQKTPEAVAYRTKFFDSPEEAQQIELYTAHVGLQSNLGDTDRTIRQLGGTRTTRDSGIVAPDTKPSVNYLNFDDFKGTFTYANNYALGGTSITLADVSDLALHSDVIEDIVPSGGDENYEGVTGDTSVPGAPDSSQKQQPGDDGSNQDGGVSPGDTDTNL